MSAGFYIGNALIMCFFESFVFWNANILVDGLEIVVMTKKQKGRINIALYFCTVIKAVPPLAQLLFVVCVAFVVVLACAVHIINHMKVAVAKLWMELCVKIPWTPMKNGMPKTLSALLFLSLFRNRRFSFLLKCFYVTFSMVTSSPMARIRFANSLLAYLRLKAFFRRSSFK